MGDVEAVVVIDDEVVGMDEDFFLVAHWLELAVIAIDGGGAGDVAAGAGQV